MRPLGPVWTGLLFHIWHLHSPRKARGHFQRKFGFGAVSGTASLRFRPCFGTISVRFSTVFRSGTEIRFTPLWCKTPAQDEKPAHNDAKDAEGADEGGPAAGGGADEDGPAAGGGVSGNGGGLS